MLSHKQSGRPIFENIFKPFEINYIQEILVKYFQSSTRR